jgi:hypothetical protein
MQAGQHLHDLFQLAHYTCDAAVPKSMRLAVPVMTALLPQQQ